jgi:hypothetical protein
VNYFHLMDESRLTLNYMVSSLLYEDTLSFPIELVSVEVAYLIASIVFEVNFPYLFIYFLINLNCRAIVLHGTVQHQVNVFFVYVFLNVIIFKYKKMVMLLLNRVQYSTVERKIYFNKN